MELKDFIKTSLVDIITGIKEAQDGIFEVSGAAINPIGDENNKEFKNAASDLIHRFVEFDVAVSVSNKVGGKGGASINVVAANIGAQGEALHSHESASRIKFKVAVKLPSQGISGR